MLLFSVVLFSRELPVSRTTPSILCGGLVTLTLVLEDKDVIGRFTEWGVPELLKAVLNDFPPFPGKKILVEKISSAMPGSGVDALLESIAEKGEVILSCALRV